MLRCIHFARIHSVRVTLCALAIVCSFSGFPVQAATPNTDALSEGQASKKAHTDNPVYDYDTASRDGIGKFYMGREISHVMGHRGAGWLERANREREERTDLLVKALELGAQDVVADIGAGTGYFSFRISPYVPKGRVMAVDIQPQMLTIIRQRTPDGVTNVIPVAGTVTAINVEANSVDLMLLVDAYHEFSHPREMGESMFRALKPGGRIALVEYRGEDPRVPIKPLHKMTQEQAIREMNALGLQWQETVDVLPQQHLMFFIKPGEK